jgi:hypothetical protein
MRVPRPFDPEVGQLPQGKEYQRHIEQEEKPLADEKQQQSEDFHGGNESTESLPNSPNEGSEKKEEQQKSGESSANNSQQSESSNGEQSQQSNTNGSSTSNVNEQNSFDGKQSQDSGENNNQQTSESQQSGSNESVNESSTDDTSEQLNSENKPSENQQQGSSGTESSESGDGQQSSGEQSENQSSRQTDDSEESNNEQEASDSDSQGANGEDGETSSDTSNASEEGDTDDDANDTNGQNDETFDSEEQEEVSDSSEETEEQVNSGTYNTNQVFTYTETKNNSKLSRTLYDFIEYIADETKVFNNLSADYYDPKKLMLRRYQGKSLNATKSGKVRETIVVLLDNSGSMQWVSEHVLEVAKALIQRHDAEIYFTPNGKIETQITKQGEVPAVHTNVINKIVTQQLKVLYLGDFDGADTPIELSWKTKVFWLCPESRYRYFRSHRWVHYNESDFRGFFARTYDAKEMIQALKRFSGFAQFSRFWYDLHESEEFEDD